MTIQNRTENLTQTSTNFNDYQGLRERHRAEFSSRILSFKKNRIKPDTPPLFPSTLDGFQMKIPIMVWIKRIDVIYEK